MNIAGLIYHGASLHIESSTEASGQGRDVLVTATWIDVHGEEKKCGLKFTTKDGDSYAMIADSVQESLAAIFRHMGSKFYNAEPPLAMVAEEM